MKSMHKAMGLVSVADLAVRLGRPHNTVWRWQRIGVIPSPTHRLNLGTRYHYTEEEAAEIVARFKEEVK